MMAKSLRFADRVFQLESNNLDNEFDKVIDQTIDSLNIPSVSDEIKLLVKLYLFRNYIKGNATIGMRVYNSFFYDTDNADKELRNKVPASYKLALLTSFNLILPYLSKRYAAIENAFNLSYLRSLKFSWLDIENITMTIKCLNMLNFLVFLRNGKYLSIQERVLGISPVITDQDYYNNLSNNKAQMEFMNRDTIWRALAEFITASIPHINTKLMKNQILRIFGLMTKVSSDLTLAEKILSHENIGKCVICEKQPFDPYIIGCRHVFCYYCLHSKYLSDPSDGFVCLLCKYNTKDESQVKRYKAYRFMRQIKHD